jgi:hypothetical protein
MDTVVSGVYRDSCGMRSLLKRTLDIRERLILGQLLPLEGNALMLKTVREIVDMLSITDAEKEYVKIDGAQMSWDDDKLGVVQYTFSKAQAGVISETLEKLDKTEKLTRESLPLFEKFVR